MENLIDWTIYNNADSVLSHEVILIHQSLQSKCLLDIVSTLWHWLGIRDEVQTFDDSDNIKDIDLETKEIKQILKGEETEQ